MYAFDKKRKGSFETDPCNVALQMVFNRVEIKGNECKGENALPGCESIIVTVSKRIINKITEQLKKIFHTLRLNCHLKK